MEPTRGEAVAPSPGVTEARVRSARLAAGSSVRGWAVGLSPLTNETRWSQAWARIGVLSSITALVVYSTWRILFTLPPSGWNLVAAWLLIAFEIFPVFGLVIRAVTLWNIDTRAPAPVTGVKPGQRAAVLIPTYNEPVEVIAPTIAAACALEPAHQTWVLDDGDRPWVAELCRGLGARYVRRDEHTHAKAGNMNHAMELMHREIEDGAEPIDIIAVLDCDHVPLPGFLRDSLGWFDDPELALVQAPQTYYNSGAFDDDGDTGEQGMFFHVLLPARNHDGAGPFWCGSTSLIRLSALREVGGISTATIVEDMHTTLALIRAGWKTAYHHQVLAVGLAPDTPEQYLLQRRRWGMGSMQVLVTERLWAAKRWLSWRNYYEYLSGTVYWLEGVGTVFAFLIPVLILVSGAQVSTADPLTFSIAFVAMFSIRLWGSRRMFRLHLHWLTAFALRILRVPVGLSCLWWLITRRTLEFQVTPKSGADDRLRGRAPTAVWALIWLMVAVAVYALLGLSGLVPWHVDPASTVASGLWLVLAGTVLVLGVRRIQSDAYATSRRNAHRFNVQATVSVGAVEGELVDISVGGAAVRFARGTTPPDGDVEFLLPGADPVTLQTVRMITGDDGTSTVTTYQVRYGDWAAYRTISMWLFHTPPGAVEGLPAGVPAVAVAETTQRGQRTLARQYGRDVGDPEDRRP
ncbi:glycosyltransferase family 2 protein [Microlunatus aurantiacus]|uniref:glycosyltransferase family 2 protein n=1 Tax=Microlunatus aurantiacus TaxID=446786 RepID=UPI0031E2FF8A